MVDRIHSHPKYTAQQVIDALHGTKGLVSLAARQLGCDPETVRKYARRHPSVQQAMDDARAAMVDVAELSLYKAIQAGEPWAVALVLKTLGKNRGYVERVQLDLEPLLRAVAVQFGLNPDAAVAEAERVLAETAVTPRRLTE